MKKRKIDNFVKQYSIVKTPKFKAVPIGKTLDNINNMNLIEQEKKRNEDYREIKRIADKYHCNFINRILSELRFSNLEKYLDAWNSDTDTELTAIEDNMRQELHSAFENDEEWTYISNNHSKFFTDLLPKYFNSNEEIELLNSCKGFTTSFINYCDNREYIYSGNESNSIAYRCIDENLPKYASNIIVFEKIKEALGKDIMDTMNKEYSGFPFNVEDCFEITNYNNVLTNDNIIAYNTFVGGFSKEDGTKIKGLNEYINLYNQQLSKEDKKKKLPLFKMLYKQILSNDDSYSFTLNVFENEFQIIEELKNVTAEYSDLNSSILCLKNLIENISGYNLEEIYIQNDKITNVSNRIFGNWNRIKELYEEEYRSIHKRSTRTTEEKYQEKIDKEYKKELFSIKRLNDLIRHDCSENEMTIEGYLVDEINKAYQHYSDSMKELIIFLNKPEAENMLIDRNEIVIELIKNYLDKINNIRYFMKLFLTDCKGTNQDTLFYGDFCKHHDMINPYNKLYNKIRNFITKKSYSLDKFKLWFDNPAFLGGWDTAKEKDYTSTILLRNNKYYLAVINRNNKSALQVNNSGNEIRNGYKKIVVKSIPSAAKYFSKKQILPQNPPQIIKEYFEKKDNKKLTLEDDRIFMKYIIEDFIVNYNRLKKSNGENYFDFHFKHPSEYKNLNEFFNDIDNQAYSLSYEWFEKDYIDSLVENGDIFLFQIYTKDFSSHSYGSKNLNTLYFEQSFNSDGNVRLAGGAELFFRPASIESEITHHKGDIIRNKNKLNPCEKIADRDLIKDKRFSENHFELHLPIYLNKNGNSQTKNINSTVRKLIKEEKNQYIIGIDRGERNLIYICVIDNNGKIVEQRPLNRIVADTNGTKIETDYNELLNYKQYEIRNAKQDWKTIDNIKNLKSGYLGQVIHEICELIQKYDAIVVLEDLTLDFMNKRKKVEKNIYQAFETKLISKLNYLTNKNTSLESIGSVINGLQLTNNANDNQATSNRFQNGFIFYVSPNYTSKIDPTTGFINLFSHKYTNKELAKKFILKFDFIKYDSESDLFVFKANTDAFGVSDKFYKKEWEICSYGQRIQHYKENGKFTKKTVNINNEFKKLFEIWGIKWNTDENLCEKICEISSSDFYKDFIKLFNLTVQMRNYSIGDDSNIDYIISPIRNADGYFFDSRRCGKELPQDGDANGAYNIARKALCAVRKIQNANIDEVDKIKTGMNVKEWLEYAQS